MSRMVELFAVQPRITIDDYASLDAFAAKHRALAERVEALRERDPDGQPLHEALVVWPEMVGAFLGLAGEVERVRDCATGDAAMTRIALRRLPSLLATMARHRTVDSKRALFTMIAPIVHQGMYATFSAIAREHGWWVVAGSALLPRNALGEDSAGFHALPGSAGAEVFNTSFTFAPDGRCVRVTRKVNLVPTQEDVLHLSAGSPADLGVVGTPFGNLGTAICYDGFDEAHTGGEPGFTPCGAVLDRLGADIVAQPSANAWAWDAPWTFNEPGEALLRREQWFAEGFAKHLAGLERVRYVVNPQLVGTVLDTTFEAPSLILERTSEGVAVLAEAADYRTEEIIVARVPAPIPAG